MDRQKDRKTKCPRHYHGNGIDFRQNNVPFPGYSELGRHGVNVAPYNSSLGNRDQGPNKSTYAISQDLLMTTPGSNIMMTSANGEKMRTLYIAEITDTESGRVYPVAKVKPTVYTWCKWKLASADDSTYTNDPVTYPVGSEVRFKFGDFEAVPTTSITSGNKLPYIRAAIYFETNALADYDTSVYPSGIIDNIPGKGYTPNSSNHIYWLPSNANVVNNSYVEADCTYTESGLINIDMYWNYYDDANGLLKRDGGVRYGYVITISG